MARRPTSSALAGAPGNIALHKLPVQLRMLVRLMGEAAAYRLLEHRGGTPYKVPTLMQGQRFIDLADLVGPAAAAALVAELSGVSLQLPKNDAVLRQLRHQRVLELRAEGHTLAVVARATGYTVRQVINICNAGSVGLGQGEQFDMFGMPDGDEDELEADADLARPAGLAHDPFGLRDGLQGGAPGANAPEVV